METMFLSIITPTYNSQDKILFCINSVIKQNFEDYEHIIIDNHSTDRTLELIKGINNTFKHFKKKSKHQLYKIT